MLLGGGRPLNESLPYRWERRRLRSRRAAQGEGRGVCGRTLPRSQRTATQRQRSPEQRSRAPPTAPHPLRARLSRIPALRRRGGGKTAKASPTALPQPHHSQLFQTRLVLWVSSRRGPRCVGKRLRRWQSWVLLPGRRGSGGDGSRGRGSCLVCFRGCEQSSRAAAPWAAETRLVCKGGGGRRKGRGASEGRQAMAVGCSW